MGFYIGGETISRTCFKFDGGRNSLLHAGIPKHDGHGDSRGRHEEETSSQSRCDCWAPLHFP